MTHIPTYGMPETRTGGRRVRLAKHVSPRLLDWVLNGVPVYIRRRPADGVAYATIHDFSKFISEPPLETIRVKITKDTARDFDVETHPDVIKALERHK